MFGLIVSDSAGTLALCRANVHHGIGKWRAGKPAELKKGKILFRGKKKDLCQELVGSIRNGFAANAPSTRRQEQEKEQPRIQQIAQIEK